MKLTRALAVALEGVGCCIVLVGISIEVYYGADFGFVLITSGAVVIAFGGMLFAKLVRGGKI